MDSHSNILNLNIPVKNHKITVFCTDTSWMTIAYTN